MRYKLHAMDTFFFNTMGEYPWEVRCEMLRELGYDGTYFTFHWGDREADWTPLSHLTEIRPRYGLDVAAVFFALDVARPETDPRNARVLRALETMEGCSSAELALLHTAEGSRPSDPALDDDALHWFERLDKVAEARGLRLGLYPHITWWCERFTDAVRLADRFGSPRIRPIFAGFHWYACDHWDSGLQARLEPLLAEQAPHLHSVNLCGSRMNAHGGGRSFTIEPLDEGEMDNFAVLALLRKHGFTGPVGLQGYAIGSDTYLKLERGIRTFRAFEERLDRHPGWALQWRA